ncbi:LysR family transcriptional regulator, partial [Streptomyces sp. NPDC059766]|uniref:LysR family transcriptional regulator n=1 Tax=Streptomyces sp. NPDC059766 TaxID=3346940 RepID=UPI003648B586
MELLVAVAETGSLSQAAARFAISRPYASARTMTLERRPGVELQLRTTRGSRLTPAGLVVTDWARGVLESAAAFVEGTAALRSRQEGRLRAGSSLTVGSAAGARRRPFAPVRRTSPLTLPGNPQTHRPTGEGGPPGGRGGPPPGGGSAAPPPRAPGPRRPQP